MAHQVERGKGRGKFHVLHTRVTPAFLQTATTVAAELNTSLSGLIRSALAEYATAHPEVPEDLAEQLRKAAAAQRTIAAAPRHLALPTTGTPEG